MTKTRIGIIVGIGLFVSILPVSFVTVLVCDYKLPPRNIRANVAKVKKGMTRTEVNEVFSELPVSVPSGEPSHCMWTEGWHAAVVSFDANGRVTSSGYIANEGGHEESEFAKLYHKVSRTLFFLGI